MVVVVHRVGIVGVVLPRGDAVVALETMVLVSRVIAVIEINAGIGNRIVEQNRRRRAEVVA